ncbi:trace amine-associated receptor 13c-like [Lampris incognitus]|uniref:trace amine-associated receptor 13c-like n=1 Tax=Lampris incognitus TaxID=2546036 RepID=UPI0024B5F075|nr:trace amine-associated receptor 13c-like [Lampris incognitus]
METLEGGELCFPQLLNSSCRKPMRPRSEAVLLHILLSSISLLTVALNLLVIISISHFRQLHTPTNLLLLSLAVSDLAVGVVKIPGEGSRFIGACWFLGDPMCALYHFIGFVIVAASVGNMVLISIDRYVAICDPLHYPTKITLRKIQISVCLCWLCSVFCNGLILRDHLKQPDKYKSCDGECVLVVDYIEGAVDLVLNFVGPITVIIVLYMRVFVVAVSQARAMRFHIVSVPSQGTVTVTAKKSEMKAARTLGVVIVVFLMCFFPFYFALFLARDTLINVSSWSILSCLLFFNSCLNPVIYAFLYPWFRKAVKIIGTLQILQPGSCAANVL